MSLSAGWLPGQLARVAVAVTLIVGLMAAPPVVVAQQDPRFFSQTNFRVDNDAFWDFFQHARRRAHVRLPGVAHVQARRLPRPDLPARSHAAAAGRPACTR